MKKLPESNDRMYMHHWYAHRYNQYGNETSAQLAMWYHFLHLAFDPQPETKPMTKPKLSSNFNEKNVHGQLLEVLEIIRDYPSVRRGKGGICAAVIDMCLNLGVSYFNVDDLLEMLKAYMQDWKHYSGFPAYPIPSSLHTDYENAHRTYNKALKQRKSWTRSTWYGNKRWELLEHCIKEAKVRSLKRTKPVNDASFRKAA